MTESAEQIAERIIAANSDWPASAFPKTAAAITSALTAAHQERDAAIRRAEQAEAHAAALREALDQVNDLISESSGVYGLHLNGDMSPWGELLPPGRYSAWLDKLPEALASTPATSLAALEKRVMLECAAWHDEESDACINGMHSGMSNSDRRHAHNAAEWHRRSAAAIRKLAEEK